jgi:CubicO group peptidase (beta-lactamase class C family)
VYVYLRHEDEPTGALNAVTLRQLASQTAGSEAP